MAQSIANGSIAQTVEEDEEDFGPLLIKKLEVCFVVNQHNSNGN